MRFEERIELLILFDDNNTSYKHSCYAVLKSLPGLLIVILIKGSTDRATLYSHLILINSPTDLYLYKVPVPTGTYENTGSPEKI